MTYGRWLDTAATALDTAAILARRTQAADHTDVGSVLHARDRVVRALYGLTSMLEPATPPAHPSRRPSPAERLPDHAVLLRRALDHTRLPLPAQPEPTHAPELADHLGTAANGLQVAGDILASHVDPTNGPRTPEGAAIRLGAGRIEALAELARLTGRLASVDVHLGQWAGGDEAMPPSPAAGHQTALATIDTWLGGVDRHAIAVVGDSSHRPSLVRTLTVAAADRAPTTTTAADCAATLDDIAVWLFRHPDQVEGYHLAAAIRLGQLAASVRQHLHHGPPPPALAGWRGAAIAAGNINAAPPPQHDPRLIELEHATDLLGAVPHDGEAFARLVPRLPRLAAAVRVATDRAVRRGVIFTRSASLQANPVRAIRRAVVEWTRATPSDPVIAQLIGGLSTATAQQATNDPANVGVRAGRAFPPLSRLSPARPPAPTQDQPHPNRPGARSTRSRT
jgi:hypothetical protein